MSNNVPNLVEAMANQLNVPQVPIAPAPPAGAVPESVLSIFGQDFQKKHVYIFGLIALAVVGFILWKWYSNKNEHDDDEEEEDDEDMPFYPPPGYMQHMQQQQMQQQQMPPQMQQQMPPQDGGYPDQQFDEQIEQAVHDV